MKKSPVRGGKPKTKNVRLHVSKDVWLCYVSIESLDRQYDNRRFALCSLSLAALIFSKGGTILLAQQNMTACFSQQRKQP